MKLAAGQVAFVTGATGAIGQALVRALLDEGLVAIFTYRRPAALQEMLRHLATYPAQRVRPVQVDVTDRDGLRAVADDLTRELGGLHVLCNCAAATHFGAIEDATPDENAEVMGVNLGGVINTLATLLPLMKGQGEGGHVVNVASMSSFIARPRAGIHTASQFALRGLSESLRLALPRYGIGISLVCPPLRGQAADVDADDVARRVIEAVRNNTFYVFPDGQLEEEIRASNASVLAAFPDEPPDPQRQALEERRWAARKRAYRER